ncbi:MAG: hypothetical protein K2P55_09900, partial [Bacteroides acidifaciens]|nr:hypothetical protein [Bacteroides acidifaciens]
LLHYYCCPIKRFNRTAIIKIAYKGSPCHVVGDDGVYTDFLFYFKKDSYQSVLSVIHRTL